MARRFTRGRVAAGSRRLTSWFTIPPASVTMTSTGGSLISSLNAAGLARRPFTIIRTHLTVHMASDQIIADEIQAMAVGMCVVSDQATAIGVTAVPTPDTDRASDLWYLHQDLMSDFSFATGVGFDAQGGSVVHIDSKAMRKVNDDQDVLLVAELSSGISNGLFARFAGRFLVKDH